MIDDNLQSEKDTQFIRLCSDEANNLSVRISQGTRTPPVSAAVELLLKRVMDSTSAVALLSAHKGSQLTFDLAMVLRGMYDAMLQGLFILRDQKTQVERAELFLDYVVVEQYALIQRIDHNPTWLAKTVGKSRRRSQSEPCIVLQRHFGSRKLKRRDDASFQNPLSWKEIAHGRSTDSGT